jgi:CRISPR system Cascade subunit CasA
LALWQKLWLHVPQSRPLDQARLHLAFPWLAPTKTSAKKESMSVSDADLLQAFFGMPRRIRLIFQMNEARRPCDLTGEVADIVVTGFIAEPWGVNYGVFSHPLTPYRKIKTDTLPVHTPKGQVATGNGSGSSMPAPMDLAFRRRPSSRRRRVCATSTLLTGETRG